MRSVRSTTGHKRMTCVKQVSLIMHCTGRPSLTAVQVDVWLNCEANCIYVLMNHHLIGLCIPYAQHVCLTMLLEARSKPWDLSFKHPPRVECVTRLIGRQLARFRRRRIAETTHSAVTALASHSDVTLEWTGHEHARLFSIAGIGLDVYPLRELGKINSTGLCRSPFAQTSQVIARFCLPRQP